MGFSLKGLFKKKPGGTFVGNLIRGTVKTVKSVASTAVSAIPVIGPVASKVLDKLPIGEGLMMMQPPAVQEQAVEAITAAAAAPPQDRTGALDFARTAKSNAISNGADPETADRIGQATFEAASGDQVPAGKVAQFKKTIAGTILNGAANGAKEGAMDAFLNDTDPGKQAVKDATNNQIQKYLPWGLAAVIGFLILKKR